MLSNQCERAFKSGGVTWLILGSVRRPCHDVMLTAPHTRWSVLRGVYCASSGVEVSMFALEVGLVNVHVACACGRILHVHAHVRCDRAQGGHEDESIHR
jgi:hypothetical protein